MIRLPVHLLLYACPLLAWWWPAASQSYYFNGAFADAQGRPLAYVNIKPFSSPIAYQAGNAGEYGLPSFQASDSAWCYLEGYDSLRVLLQHGRYQKHVLAIKPSYAEKLIRASRLSSLTRLPAGLLPETTGGYRVPGESYHQLVENPWNQAREAPFTGFVPNHNKSSYANIRRFVRQSSKVPPNAVRVEELWNYFSLRPVPPPDSPATFALHAVRTSCPWDSTLQLVTVYAVARQVNIDSLPPVNMVFLIDNSGSMEEANRLPLLKAGFRKLVEHLRSTDRVGIVTYGGAAGIYLPPTFGHEKEKIRQALDSIEAGGATSGANGIQLAYELATTNAFSQGLNKVILATDGDFNVGVSDEAELETLIGRYRSTGVTLSCMGVGMGNYKDSKIEVLARLGNGHFAYLDSEEEAERALLQQLGENSITVARDVTIQFGFDERAVKRYRLIGYENKVEALQVVPQQLIGSEVMSGQCIVGMAELETHVAGADSLTAPGFFEIQYKWPDRDTVERMTLELPYLHNKIQATDSVTRAAVTLAWLGRILKSEPMPGQQRMAGPLQLAAGTGNGRQSLAEDLSPLLQKLQAIYEPVPASRRGRQPKTKGRDQ